MHIDKLIEQTVEVLPYITSEEKAQEFLNTLDASDQMAIFSAYNVGNTHIGYDRLQVDHITVHRHLESHVSQANYANMLYMKRMVMKEGLQTFIRCTEASGFNRSNF
ncbi:hypothetical protein [Rahnella aquatilis]|uniref:hypothetical protein n=1 Tax=Rahnella aquatilis TaxID=34038 RepID=UPI000648329D|nr:hypothetical protein [Rahnella aquatilis]